jgi:hypothetical protein
LGAFQRYLATLEAFHSNGLAVTLKVGCLNSTVPISLEGPTYLDGLQEKDPSFEAWKRASYEFLCQEFGKENLVYLYLNQYKSIYAIHCIFVPIASNQLAPQAFVGTSLQQQGYINRYQAVLDRLFKQDPSQDKDLQAIQAPKANYDKSHTGSSTHDRFYGSVTECLRTIERMDLATYLIKKHGYELNKKKSTKKWIRLDHQDGTKLLVYRKKGIYRYKSLNDEQDSGTIVDYLLRRGCKDDEEVVAKVLGGYLSKEEYVRLNQEQSSSEGEQRSDEPGRDPAFYQKEAQSELDKFGRHYYGETYLEARGIEPTTYQGIQGMKTNYLGAIFCLYREVDTQGQGKLCSTINYFPGEEGEGSRKYFQKGLPKGLSVLKPSGEIKEILLTESPIDALSHKQLYGTKHTLYLSTCGNLKKEIADGLKAIFIQAKKQSIVIKLGFDGMTKAEKWPSK